MKIEKKLILLRKTVKSGHFESMVLRDGRAKNSDPWRNAYRVEGSLRPYAYRNFGLHPQWVRDRWNLNLCRFHPPHKKVKFRSNSPKPSRHGLPFGQWIHIDKLQGGCPSDFWVSRSCVSYIRKCENFGLKSKIKIKAEIFKLWWISNPIGKVLEYIAFE